MFSTLTPNLSHLPLQRPIPHVTFDPPNTYLQTLRHINGLTLLPSPQILFPVSPLPTTSSLHFLALNLTTMSSPSPITYFLNEDSIPVLRAMIAAKPGKGNINTYRHQEKKYLWDARGISVTFFNSLSPAEQLARAREAWMKIDLLRRHCFLYDEEIPGTQPMPMGEELVRVFHTQTPSITTLTPPSRVVMARATSTPLPPL